MDLLTCIIPNTILTLLDFVACYALYRQQKNINSLNERVFSLEMSRDELEIAQFAES